MTIENLIRAIARQYGYEVVGNFRCVKIEDVEENEIYRYKGK